MRCLFLLCALLVLPAVAAAQDDAARARQHFDAGVRHFQTGEFRQALDSFRDAYRIQPHPSVLVNIANCYMEIGRPVDAAQHFERYLRESGEDVDPEQRAEVERALGQARAAIATIDVTGAPGISVFVDGDAIGRTPLRRPAEVNPGPHVVEMRAPDGALRRDRVGVEPGQSLTIDAGTPPGTEPPRSTEGGGGLPGPGPGPSNRSAGEPIGPGVAPPPDEGGGLSVPVATWIAGGVAVVALALGVTFGAIALSQQSEFDDIARDIQSRPPGDPAIPDLQAEGRAVADAQAANALVADLMIITAVAAAGVAVVFLLTSDDDEAPTATAGIAPLPDGAALTLRSAF